MRQAFQNWQKSMGVWEITDTPKTVAKIRIALQMDVALHFTNAKRTVREAD